jgi:hypothetical protein
MHDIFMIRYPGALGVAEGEKRATPMVEARKVPITHQPKAHFQ